MTALVSKRGCRRQRAPKIGACELRKLLWQKFGHRCALVKTEKKKTRTVIHVKVECSDWSPKFKKICNFLSFWDECLDANDKQVVNVIRV